MILSVHQPQYIPWLGYFDKIQNSDSFVLLDQVQYKRREFQNRNKIRTKEGWMWLTVPVISKGRNKQIISEVDIDNDSEWQKQHLRSLEVCYGGAKFFDDYLAFFEELYVINWQRLLDINVRIINYILKQLSISTPIYFESKLNINNKKTDRIIEICKKLKCDTYLSGIGGKSYLEEGKFAEAGIKLIYQEFVHPLYHQRFMSNGEDFIPYMSMLDLLFNEGPKAREILRWTPHLIKGAG